MVPSLKWFAATATTLSILFPVNALLTQELNDRKLPDCISETKFDDISNKGSFWFDSGAEQFADDYINSNVDHTEWAQNLFREILPEEDHSAFDCETPEADCIMNARCDAFNAVGKGGLFYLYVSLRNYHTYMKALDYNMNEGWNTNALSVSAIQDILHLSDGTAEEPLDLFAVLGAAASLVGTAGGANPAIAGAAGALSGVFALASELNPKPEDTDDLKSMAKSASDAMIKSTAEQTRTMISQLVGAVFGRNGQTQDVIPQNMRRGGVTNPAVSVLGWGDWLRDNGGTAIAETQVNEIKTKADQSLLWQMARLFKRTYVVVRSDLPLESCNSPNNAWDAEKSRCLDLLSWDGTTDGTLGGANDLNDMWGLWGMDPFWTMRNAVDCWEANDGKIGEVSFTQTWESDLPPPCFFATEVLKGDYSDIAKGTLWLKGDFAGQSGMEGKLWPKDKCESAIDFGDDFETGDEECNYTWGE